MSARGAFLTVLASALFACALPSAAQDENPTTPGAIPNAGSYQGSIALQQQQQQQEQAQQQQNLQMQQRLDQTYRAYAPPAKAVATITTDATGKAQAGPLPAGRYYAVGLATYQGRRVFWLRGINLVAGVNGLTLDQTDGGALP